MRKLQQHVTRSPDSWAGDEHVLLYPDEAEVPSDKTAKVVLRDMGLVLTGALGFAFAVNIVLVALHIG